MRINKFTKKLSCVVCIGIVIYEQQSKKASPTYQKILKRFDKSLTECKDLLPKYSQKEVDRDLNLNCEPFHIHHIEPIPQRYQL